MHNYKLLTACFSLSLFALGLGCGDGYVPPKDIPIFLDGNNAEEPPAGSAGVWVGTPSGALIEGGSPVSVSVKLLRAPTAPVTLGLSSSNMAEGTVSPAQLTFNEQDWSQAKEVTLTPGDDEVADGDKRWQLNFTISSEDATFASEQVRPLNLTTIDNDVAPQIVITPVGEAKTTEAGGSVTVQVVLTRQPSSEVLIPVRIEDPSEASTTTTSVTLNALDWNVPHELVITGLDDMTKDGDVRYKLTLGPANSTDPAFNGIGPSSLELTNIDGVCGDGQVQRAHNEECDEPTTTCDYDLMSCQVCGPSCTYIAGALQGYCGDNKLQAEFEDCDGPTKPCAYGQTSCMTCRDCQSVPGEVTGYCGDGVVQRESGEECDGAAMCPVFGTAACNNCKVDAISCSTFSVIAVGQDHSCALLANGAFRCWGSNTKGQSPTLSSMNVGALIADNDSTCVSVGAAVNCYGRANGRVQLFSPMVQIDLSSMILGTTSLCGLTATGQIQCSTNGPDTIRTAAPTTGIYMDIAVSHERACALAADGYVKCWGQGTYETPTMQLLDIAGEFDNFCGIKASDGSLICWNGGPTDPLKSVPQLTGFFALDINSDHGCALNASGMTCWGRRPLNLPKSTPGSFTQVSVGPDHTCAIKSTGELQCWGSNTAARLNIPTN